MGQKNCTKLSFPVLCLKIYKCAKMSKKHQSIDNQTINPF